MPLLSRLTNIQGLPPPSGPYSPGVSAEGRFLFVSGQGPYDPKLGRFSRGSIAEQTRLTLACIERVVLEGGGRMESIVSCRVYLQPLDAQTFAAMNAVYEEFFGTHKPARTTVGSQLLNIDVEIDCVVVLT